MTSPPVGWDHHATSRLVLDRVDESNVGDWHRIHSDPLVWTHFPTGRHTSTDQTERLVEKSVGEWRRSGLSYWSVRERANGRIVGCGGCRPLADRDRWNLYYRFDPAVQGRGYASELAGAAIEAANAVDANRPVVAIMLEHNVASWRVAEKIGLMRVWTGPDEGNPDPTAVRFVYADRPDLEL